MSDRPIIMPLDNGLWQLVEEWDGIPAYKSIMGV